jgi:hypothetical protein
MAMVVSCAAIHADGKFRAAPRVARGSAHVRPSSLTWMLPPRSLWNFTRGQEPPLRPPLLRMRGAGDASAPNQEPAASPAADPVGIGAGKAPPMRVAPSHGDVVVGLGRPGSLPCDHLRALAMAIPEMSIIASTMLMTMGQHLMVSFFFCPSVPASPLLNSPLLPGSRLREGDSCNVSTMVEGVWGLCWEEQEDGTRNKGGRLYVRTGQHSWNGPIVVRLECPLHV